MEAKAQHTIGSAVQHVKEYVDASVKLAKLKAADKTSDAITNTAAFTAAGVLGVFVLLFASITLALALGNWLDSNVWGFLIVTVFYAVLATVIILTKDKLIKMPVLNMLLKKMFKEEKGDGSNKGYETIS
jgi:uncharacterized membrane protein YgcG